MAAEAGAAAGRRGIAAAAPGGRGTGAALAAACAAVAVLVAGCGAGAADPAAAPPARATPAATPHTAPAAPSPAPAPAAEPVPAGHPTAQVVRRAWLRAAPGGRRVAVLGRRTEFGGPRILAVVARRGDWIAVAAPERPNGVRAWLPRTAVRLGRVQVALRVDVAARRLTVRYAGRVVLRTTIAVGRPGNPTPPGRYGVTDKLLMPAGSPYGCCALALSGHQVHLPSGWGGGDRLAVHGTTAPASIGQAASLGCMRASEPALRELLRIVPLGAPVTIV
jgi:lipoprotein-anchoring transpeptidase ErfK/SrfK